jgi:hypothetical protein
VVSMVAKLERRSQRPADRPIKVLYRSAGRINLATKTERSKSVAKVRRTNLQASKR